MVRSALAVGLALGLLGSSAHPARAHADSPGSLPLVPHTVPLHYRTPAEVVTLFSRARLPTEGAAAPRAARPDSDESLVPAGTDAVYRTAAGDGVVVVAREGFADVEACIAVLDVPVEQLGPGQQRVVLTPHRANTAALRTAVLRLTGAGTATVHGKQLTLTGSPAWLYQALRQVIRGELGLPLR